VFDVISNLAGVGLLTFEDVPDGGTRISMLTAVREFALIRLSAIATAEDFHRRHAAHYLSLAEQAETHLRGPHQLLWSDRLSVEHANFAAAFEWASSGGRDPVLALRLASALGWFWYTRGRASEGRAWLERVVAGQGNAIPPDATPEAMARAKALHALGVLQQQQGDNDAAAASFERSLELWRAEGDDAGVVQELNSLGVTRWAQGQPDEARTLIEESAAVARSCGDDGRLASALSNLGVVALSIGSVAQAIGSLREALAIDVQLKDTWGIAVDQSNLGAALVRHGDVAEGHRLLSDILSKVVELQDPDLFASTIEACAVAAGVARNHERAALLVGAADAIRTKAEVPRAPIDDAYLEREMSPTRAALEPDGYRDTSRRGGELSEHDLLAVARAPLTPRPG